MERLPEMPEPPKELPPGEPEPKELPPPTPTTKEKLRAQLGSTKKKLTEIRGGFAELKKEFEDSKEPAPPSQVEQPPVVSEPKKKSVSRKIPAIPKRAARKTAIAEKPTVPAQEPSPQSHPPSPYRGFPPEILEAQRLQSDSSPERQTPSQISEVPHPEPVSVKKRESFEKTPGRWKMGEWTDENEKGLGAFIDDFRKQKDIVGRAGDQASQEDQKRLQDIGEYFGFAFQMKRLAAALSELRKPNGEKNSNFFAAARGAHHFLTRVTYDLLNERQVRELEQIKRELDSLEGNLHGSHQKSTSQEETIAEPKPETPQPVTEAPPVVVEPPIIKEKPVESKGESALPPVPKPERKEDEHTAEPNAEEAAQPEEQPIAEPTVSPKEGEELLSKQSHDSKRGSHIRELFKHLTGTGREVWNELEKTRLGAGFLRWRSEAAVRLHQEHDRMIASWSERVANLETKALAASERLNSYDAHHQKLLERFKDLTLNQADLDKLAGVAELDKARITQEITEYEAQAAALRGTIELEMKKQKHFDEVRKHYAQKADAGLAFRLKPLERDMAALTKQIDAQDVAIERISLERSRTEAEIELIDHELGSLGQELSQATSEAERMIFTAALEEGKKKSVILHEELTRSSRQREAFLKTRAHFSKELAARQERAQYWKGVWSSVTDSLEGKKVKEKKQEKPKASTSREAGPSAGIELLTPAEREEPLSVASFASAWNTYFSHNFGGFKIDVSMFARDVGVDADAPIPASRALKPFIAFFDRQATDVQKENRDALEAKLTTLVRNFIDIKRIR